MAEKKYTAAMLKDAAASFSGGTVAQLAAHIAPKIGATKDAAISLLYRKVPTKTQGKQPLYQVLARLCGFQIENQKPGRKPEVWDV